MFCCAENADIKAPTMTVAESSLPWKRDFGQRDSPVQSAVVRPPTSGTISDEGSDHTSHGVGNASNESVYPVLDLNAVVKVNQGYNIEYDSDNENLRKMSKF